MASNTKKIGRSAISGRFVPIRYAGSHKSTTIVQTVKTSKKGK